MTSTELAIALVNHWRALGLEPGSPVRASALNEFERSQKIQIPADMREFYLLADGLPPGSFDPRMPIRIWPLTELEREPGRASWIRFADYLIDSHHYAIALDDCDNPVFLTGDLDQWPICSTFTRFLELLVTNDQSLLVIPDPC